LIGGKGIKSESSEVYTTINGKDWILHSSNSIINQRYGHSCVVANGKIHLIHGMSNGCSSLHSFTTVDGINWIKLHDLQGTERCYSPAVFFNNEIRLTG
jgi:hypothetical protein